MGKDRISQLPDSLITQILLHLPTKDSVKTSVLSTRWRNLWLNVPGLELHSNDFPFLYRDIIKNFTDRFLEFNSESRLQKFKIKYDECNVYLIGISDWIATAINRGAQYLDIDTLRCPYYKDFMPMEIYKSKTLVSLKLVNIGMVKPEFAVCLPCLKTMHLEANLYSDQDPMIIETLISGCPILEDLTVFRVHGDNVPVLRVRSQALKRFCVKFGPTSSIGGIECSVEIDAPRLEYMNYIDDQSDRIMVKNLRSLFMIDIDSNFNVENDSNLGAESIKKIDIVRDFLTGISNVRQMRISQPTLKVFYHYLKLGPITKFSNLSRLEASFCNLLLQMLPDLLDSCPNLKYLALNIVYLKELRPKNLELTTVPQCLLSSLECVEIKDVITGDNSRNERARSNEKIPMKVWKHKKKIWMTLVRYILENSLVLKKLILCLSSMTNQATDISKEVLKFAKRYRNCQIIFL